MLMKKLGKLAANKIKFYTVLIAVILIAIIILRFAVFRPKNTEAEITANHRWKRSSKSVIFPHMKRYTMVLQK